MYTKSLGNYLVFKSNLDKKRTHKVAIFFFFYLKFAQMCTFVVVVVVKVKDQDPIFFSA